MEFERNLRSDTAHCLPLRPAVCLSRRTLVRAAIARMKSQRLGVAVVVDCYSRPLGLFTERTVLDLLLNGVDIA